MSALGTDVLAWACILGSAAASGAGTLALWQPGEQATVECAVEAEGLDRNLVVSEHGRTLVMRVPSVPNLPHSECLTFLSGDLQLHQGGRHIHREDVRLHREDIGLHMEDLRRELEDARVRIEIVRAQAEAAEGIRDVRVIVKKAGEGSGG